MSADDVSNYLGYFVSRTEFATKVANEIQAQPPPLDSIAFEPTVENISKITSLAQQGHDISGSAAKGPQDEKKIFDSFHTLATKQQEFLSVLMAKTAFVKPHSAAPVVKALSELEAVLDKLAFDTISIVPSKASDVQKDQNALSAKLAEVVGAYKKLSVSGA